MNPPPADLANQFNISIDAANWGTDSPVQVGFPSFQYPGLSELLFFLLFSFSFFSLWSPSTQTD